MPAIKDLIDFMGTSWPIALGTLVIPPAINGLQK